MYKKPWEERLIKLREEIAARKSPMDDPWMLFSAIFPILGDLAAIEAREEDVLKQYKSLKSKILFVADCFNFLIEYLPAEKRKLLSLLSASCYYLGDEKRDWELPPEKVPETQLGNMLEWVLKGDLSIPFSYEEDNYLTEDVNSVLMSIGTQEFKQAVKELRRTVYNSNEHRDLLFVDIITAILFRQLEMR